MRLWEIAAGPRTVAYARWVTGSELFVDAPWPLQRLIEAWFEDPRVGERGGDPIEVDGFFALELPRRLGTRATRITPDALPDRAQWLLALDGDCIPTLGKRDPDGWRSNRWAPEFDLDWLVRQSARAAVRWTRAKHAGFKAGGRCPDASEMWVSLHADRTGYSLVLRRRRRLWTPPVRQPRGWLRRSQLQRLHGLLEGRL